MAKDLPRITSVNWHSCIRAYKQAVALKDSGFGIRWLCHQRMPTHYSFELFDSVNCYVLGEKTQSAHDHFKKQVEFLAKDTDIFHCHNEPDWFVGAIKAVTDKPVVFDLHDLASERDYIVREPERTSFKKADAIVTQGLGYAKIAAKRRPDLDKKGLIEFVFNSVPQSLWPDLHGVVVSNGASKLGGLIYQGGLTGTTEGGSEFRFRWWLPFMKEIVDRHIRMSAYSSSPGDYLEYKRAGVNVSCLLPYPMLLQNLTLFDWGLVGTLVPSAAFDNAMPNKLFEYIAAGLPVMVLKAPMVSEFVEKEGIGVTVESADDVKKYFADAPKYQKNVLKVRSKYSMDNEMKKVINLYNRLVGN